MCENRAELNDLLTQQQRRDGDSLISPITLTDRALYRSFFAADNHTACYGNSWTYITQACRGLGLGLKYHNGDALCSIGCHRGHYVVVRPLGALDDRIVGLLKVLRDASGKPVFIKKLFPEQVSTLHDRAEFREAVQYPRTETRPEPGEFPWDDAAFADDDTYPEMILDTGITPDCATPMAEWSANFQKARIPPADPQTMRRLCHHHQSFRRHASKFLRVGIRCQLMRYHVAQADAIRDFLLNYFGTARRQNLAAYENMLTPCAVDVLGDDAFGLVASINDDPTPQAFFFVERLDQRSAGVYAGIASRAYSGLTEFMYVQILPYLKELGIHLLNLGGSESIGLHNFKRKLAPVEERQMHMLVYEPTMH